jgi:hypothetical protein
MFMYNALKHCEGLSRLFNYIIWDTPCISEFGCFIMAHQKLVMLRIVGVIFKNIKLNWLSDIAFYT